MLALQALSTPARLTALADVLKTGSLKAEISRKPGVIVARKAYFDRFTLRVVVVVYSTHFVRIIFAIRNISKRQIICINYG